MYLSQACRSSYMFSSYIDVPLQQWWFYCEGECRQRRNCPCTIWPSEERRSARSCRTWWNLQLRISLCSPLKPAVVLLLAVSRIPLGINWRLLIFKAHITRQEQVAAETGMCVTGLTIRQKRLCGLTELIFDAFEIGIRPVQLWTQLNVLQHEPLEVRLFRTVKCPSKVRSNLPPTSMKELVTLRKPESLQHHCPVARTTHD